MSSGGWKVVDSKKNPRAEKKARKATTASQFSNATGAFADLEEMRKQAEEDKKQRQAEEAELRAARAEEEKAKKAAAEERKRRRELAEKARKAKDPRCWSVISDVITQNKSAMLKELRALLEDDLAQSTAAMKVQYVFTTFDKHCRSATMPISEGIEKYFEPLNSIMDDKESYNWVKTALDMHYNADDISTEDFLVAASTTFGAKGTTNFHDNKLPTSLGLLTCFQYLVELNKTAALAAYPAMLRTVFINGKTAEFHSPVAFTNACSVLAMALSAEGNDQGFHNSALTSFLAHCYYARAQVPEQLLCHFVQAIGLDVDELGEGDSAVTDTSAAFNYILRVSQAEKDPSDALCLTLGQLNNVLCLTAHKQKAYRNSFLPILKELGEDIRAGKEKSLHYKLAIDLCYQFVLEDDTVGKTQAMWAESIATHVTETVALLKKIKSHHGAVNPAFVVKATARLNGALNKGGQKDTGAIQEALQLLGSTKTGTSNEKLVQARKAAAGGSSQAEKKEGGGSACTTVFQTLVGLVVVGAAVAFAVQQQQLAK